MSGEIESKSYLSGTISALNPWTPRSTTTEQDTEAAATGSRKSGASGPTVASAVTAAKQGGDHSTSHGHRLRIKKYPPGCPTCNVKWFHAVDAPLRKPNYAGTPSKNEKPPPAPKKWQAFATNDSRALEAAFHKLADEEEREEHGLHHADDVSGTSDVLQESAAVPSKLRHRANRSMENLGQSEVPSPTVPVNEDYLFDVDIRQRELAPAYWMGLTYAVRRGTWFYVDGTKTTPCDENLAFQLEEGYVKLKPWIYASLQRSASQTRKEASRTEVVKESGTGSETRATEVVDGKEAGSKDSEKDSNQPPTTLLTHRLFGQHMNSIVTYQDDTTAWLLSDDFLSRMSGSVYQRFAGGAHRSGTKVIRGYQDLTKKKTSKDAKRSSIPISAEQSSSDSRARSTSRERPPDEVTQAEAAPAPADELEEQPESHAKFLERQMSNLVTTAFQEDPNKQAEEERKREEREIRDDYREVEGDDQGREVEHLVLVTHGIGQRLGARFEAFNFIHDVNEFRKTLKSVYNDSEDLQALNGEVDKLPKNCRIQVLPICWRHLLDFPQQSLKHVREELDISDADADADASFPSLDDITLEGVPALRNIVADLALDVLLYQTPAYKTHISRIVATECNRILKLFKQRNPNFSGRISLVGHSLGSAVFFDLLSGQVTEPPAQFSKPTKSHRKPVEGLKLDFDVDNLVCFGSPIALFQMLNGKTISSRSNPNQVTLDGSSGDIEDPFSDSAYTKATAKREPVADMADPSPEAVTSAPKCRQFFNVFHPTDPIAYRIEPLISPSMSALKPQALPYTKKSFLGAPMGHGLTGIPAKVGQTFSGFWSNFSSGLTNNFINRSLGISAEDAAKLGAPAPVPHHQATAALARQSAAAGTNITGGGVVSPDNIQENPISPSSIGDDERKRKLALDAAEAERDGTRPPTLIDSEIETLYSGFQKRQRTKSRTASADMGSGRDAAAGAWDDGARGRKLKREEAKVRALNKNGRVDYSIQEGAFDISFLASIASHLAYWTDEDVCHFLTSQLLSKERSIRK